VNEVPLALFAYEGVGAGEGLDAFIGAGDFFVCVAPRDRGVVGYPAFGGYVGFWDGFDCSQVEGVGVGCG